jgi:hypothetical protein
LEELVKGHRALTALTAVNLVLLVFLLVEPRMHRGLGTAKARADAPAPMLRGRALEIVDDEGKVRASIVVHPAQATVTGRSSSTAILRLVDDSGRPSVKLSTTSRGAVLALVSEHEGTYAQLFEDGLVVTKDGKQQQLP